MSEPSGSNTPDLNAPDLNAPGSNLGAYETKADVRAETVLLERAIGGCRGIIDSGVPTAVFVVSY